VRRYAVRIEQQQVARALASREPRPPAGGSASGEPEEVKA